MPVRPSLVIMCGGAMPVPDRTSDCPRRDLHTPAPSGYVDWFFWAQAMASAGATQRTCPGCGLRKVWTEPKRAVAYPGGQ